MNSCLATQQAIVAQIEAEQAQVAANRKLIARFEQNPGHPRPRLAGKRLNMDAHDEQ